MSSTSSNSGWRIARRIIVNKIDNIFHKYPKLPKTFPREDSLPRQIGSNISVKEYNAFLNRNENTGYKFNWERDHYKPTGHGEQFAADISVCGRVPNVIKPLIPRPGPPPSDVQ
ncbi:hypothetical protein RhiirA4_415776 [Rhizophagus irregularis]|uniref:Uncharacterized protein n=1 Tax=Rhizophagus irregularis TaxID=588596 RepID=A0A2I1G140_9GLOM|nr:hypothetical protein RhiirA4_415776 [Rhizophagus irregularis]